MKYLNLAAALTVCLLDAAFVCAFPLVALMILPFLFGAAFWVSAAWQALPASTPSPRPIPRDAPLAAQVLVRAEQRL